MQELLADLLGVKKHKLPSIRILDPRDMKKYEFTASIDSANAEKLIKFIDSFKLGKLKEFYKSEDVPETNDKALKVIVGDTFERDVIQSH